MNNREKNIGKAHTYRPGCICCDRPKQIKKSMTNKIVRQAGKKDLRKTLLDS
jgi:hypothetical protein